MPRGQRDYGPYAVKDVTASISDMGEVAARLGSIVTYDKRGDVVDFDNFEGPVRRWGGTAPAAATYARLDSASVRSGAQAVRLHTSNILNDEADIQKLQGVLVSQRLGHEISFSFLQQNTNFMVWILLYGDPTRYQGEVRFDNLTGVLSILTAPGVYTQVATPGIAPWNMFSFQTIKLVVDFATKKYVRLLFGNMEYDLSAYGLEAFGAAQAPQIQLGAWIENRAALGGDVWLDDSIFTQAEP